MGDRRMNLSKNFTLTELVKSEIALRKGWDNTPGEAEIANLKVLAEKVLQPVRDHFATGVKVNSGYRSPQLNKEIRGSRNSHHCLGMAADIEIPGFPNYQLADWINQNLKFSQVILEFYTQGDPNSGWVHVSYDPNALKNEALTAVKDKVNKNNTVYLPGLRP
jgi:uncharacterized protein YcbK (DUF882 family)